MSSHTSPNTHANNTYMLNNAIHRLRENRVLLPQFSQLGSPDRIPSHILSALRDIDPDEPHPLNLWRVHWYNDETRRGIQNVPAHLVLGSEVTGIPSPIVVLLGARFPMISAHKVLAAYGCLVPRLVNGEFDPTQHRALWPSTGNYCRGGVAISRILGCRGVAILPAGMSAERFAWLKRWVLEESDIICTPGTESNVKEIYDKCNELRLDPQNVILNQFAEYGNYLVHHHLTGKAMADVIHSHPGLQARAFVSATGSAGTLAAGDFLKEHLGTKIVAVEAAECPTLLANGFGEHNIQGIGDKHVPLIHNVMNTDFVAAISDRSTDALHVLFNHKDGQRYLIERRGVAPKMVDALANLGFSAICNILAAKKTAQYLRLKETEAVVTVATDSAAMYVSEIPKNQARLFPKGFDSISAAETYGQHMLGVSTDLLCELSLRDRERIFNLGYFTWVEQQGVPLAQFEERRDQRFWQKLRAQVPQWDEAILSLNQRTGMLA
ncbi:MAG TPA: pyridoxal-5'-phosphate-dependent protein subunit beta [Pseudomonadota bacterium]|nr:pyridoxal-5'-phosphate-dependent protein subunit beta [Pseudomonadota bacterium]